MFKRMTAPTLLVLCGAVILGACSSDGGLLGITGDSPAVAQTAALPDKPRVDPACQSLAAKIAELKQDGAVDRVEKAAQGKGDTVSVKRTSLARVGELNKANADFQARCSTYKPVTAAVQSTVTQPSGATSTAAVAKQADASPAKPAAAKAAAKSQ